MMYLVLDPRFVPSRVLSLCQGIGTLATGGAYAVIAGADEKALAYVVGITGLITVISSALGIVGKLILDGRRHTEEATAKHHANHLRIAVLEERAASCDGHYAALGKRLDAVDDRLSAVDDRLNIRATATATHTEIVTADADAVAVVPAVASAPAPSPLPAFVPPTRPQADQGA